MTGHVLASMNEVISNDYSHTHQAVDIVKTGHMTDDVIAFGDGTVEIVVNDFKYTDHSTKGTATYGNFIKIKHDDGTKTLYAHLKYNSILVSSGQRVSKGQKIGSMGATGNAYGAHLHFEVRDSNNQRLNPKDYLYKQESTDKNNNSPDTIEDKNEPIQSEEIIEENNKVSSEEIALPENTVDNSTESDTNASLEYESSSVEEIVKKVKSLNVDYSNKKISYLDNYDYNGSSIVDGLKGINIDDSFDSRSEIALKNGISAYKGTYKQNIYLLNLLKEGKLKY